MQHTQYLPPWRDVQPDGTLSQPYGPSPSTYARHLEQYRNWAWKMPSKDARRLEDWATVVAFMRLDSGELNPDVPEREQQVYVAVYENGHAVRWTARHLGLSRDTVRSYLQRLRRRVSNG